MYDLLKAMQIYTHAVGGTVPQTSFAPDIIVNLREGELLACPRPGFATLPINVKKGTCVTSIKKAIYSHFLTRYNDVDHFSISET